MAVRAALLPAAPPFLPDGVLFRGRGGAQDDERESEGLGADRGRGETGETGTGARGTGEEQMDGNKA